MILGYSSEKHIISPLVGADLVPYFKIGFNKDDLIKKDVPFTTQISQLFKSKVYTEKDLGTTVTSLAVSEKIGEMTTITVSIIDPLGLNFVYFSQKNREVFVEWGIKRINTAFIAKKDDEITGEYSRGIFSCVIADIGDIELRDGISTFTTTLRIGTKNSTEGKMRTFNFGTLGSMLKKLCSEIGAKSYIKFADENKALTNDYYFVQNNKTNLAFLREMCNALNLKLITTDGGTVTAVITQITITDMAFVNDSTTFPDRVKTSGKYHYLDYGNANSNIISGKLQTNNNGGTGSTASIVDGKLVLSVSKDEQVLTYELDTKKIEAILRSKGFKDGYELVSEINSKSQDELYGAGGLYETYFKANYVRTYPEGQGYTASFEVVANPLFNLNDQVWLGLVNREKDVSGIPKFLKNPEATSGIAEKFRTNPKDDESIKKTIWHFTGVEQSITTDGYRMSVELAR